LRNTSRSWSWWGIEALVRVRDGHHVVARPGRPADVGGAERDVGQFPLIGLKRERLGRGSGLGGDDEERGQRIEVVESGGHRGRVRGVEDADLDAVAGRAEHMREQGRRKAAAAHAPEHHGRESLRAQPGRKCRQLARGVGEVERRLQPAQSRGDGPLDDVLVAPYRWVPPADCPVSPSFLDGTVARRGQRLA
jgi:hypothetical protein